MKKLPLILCAFLTLLALCVGFFLPHAVCAVQDKSARALRESYDTDNVTLSFAPVLSIGEKLARCNRGYSYVTGLDTGKKMDREAAMERANEIVTTLFSGYSWPFGRLDAAVTDAYPQLYVYADGDGASVVNWICSCAMDDEGFYLDVLIDDETGALMAMNMSWSYVVESVYPYAYGAEVSEPSTEEAMYILADYISDETGFSSYSVERGSLYVNGESFYGQYIVTFYDAEGNTFQTNFECGGSYFIFNF